MGIIPRLRRHTLLMAALATLTTPALGTPLPEASTTPLFASFGDMPYRVPTDNYRQHGHEAEDTLLLRRLIQPSLQRRRDIPFLIYLGDIGRVEDACTRPWLETTLLEWQRIGKPLVYTPGDNDWVDCAMIGVQPLERLKELREVFYSNKRLTTANGTTLSPSVFTGAKGLCTSGISGIPGLSCESNPPGSMPENVRWSYRNVAFATIHATASDNGWVESNASRQKEHAARVQAMKEVLRELQQSAIQQKREAVVVATQVDPFLANCQGHQADICDAVRQLARNLPVPVLLVHGDTNGYCLEQPMADAPNLWRLNGVGDYKVIDADLVYFDPANASKPFTVRGLLTGLQPPSRCNYRAHEPDDNLRYNRLAALVPLPTADCDHRTVTDQITPAAETHHGEVQQSLRGARPGEHTGDPTQAFLWGLAVGGVSGSHGAGEGGSSGLGGSPVEGAADYTVRVSDGRGQLRFQETVKGTQVILPATLRCDEAGLSVSVSAHSDQRVPGPPSYRATCPVAQGQ